MPVSEEVWYGFVKESCFQLDSLLDDKNEQDPDMERVWAKVDKSLKYCNLMLSEFTCVFWEQPELLEQFPNPCDPSIPKRQWEHAMKKLRDSIRVAQTQSRPSADLDFDHKTTFFYRREL